MPNKDEMEKKVEKIEQELATVSKAFHELSMEKQNKKTKFWKTVAIVAIILCIISNALWPMYRMSLEKVTQTTTTTETVTYDIDSIEQSADGNNHLDIIGGDKIGNTEN